MDKYGIVELGGRAKVEADNVWKPINCFSQLGVAFLILYKTFWWSGLCFSEQCKPAGRCRSWENKNLGVQWDLEVSLKKDGLYSFIVSSHFLSIFCDKCFDELVSHLILIEQYGDILEKVWIKFICFEKCQKQPSHIIVWHDRISMFEGNKNWKKLVGLC